MGQGHGPCTPAPLSSSPCSSCLCTFPPPRGTGPTSPKTQGICTEPPDASERLCEWDKAGKLKDQTHKPQDLLGWNNCGYNLGRKPNHPRRWPFWQVRWGTRRAHELGPGFVLAAGKLPASSPERLQAGIPQCQEIQGLTKHSDDYQVNLTEQREDLTPRYHAVHSCR